METDWDSGKTFFGAAFIASLAAGALVLLPPLARGLYLTLAAPQPAGTPPVRLARAARRRPDGAAIAV